MYYYILYMLKWYFLFFLGEENYTLYKTDICFSAQGIRLETVTKIY